MQGLRTLCLANKVMEEEEWADWDRRYQSAAADLEDRDAQLAALYLEAEAGLELVGVTAIEDKLQDGVPESIHTLLQAGIKASPPPFPLSPPVTPSSPLRPTPPPKPGRGRAREHTHTAAGWDHDVFLSPPSPHNPNPWRWRGLANVGNGDAGSYGMEVVAREPALSHQTTQHRWLKSTPPPHPTQSPFTSTRQ